MKYLKKYESIFNDNRKNTLFKVGDYVVSNTWEYPIQIKHIYSEYNTPKEPCYECEILYDEHKNFIGGTTDHHESELRLATNDDMIKLTAIRYNI